MDGERVGRDIQVLARTDLRTLLREVDAAIVQQAPQQIGTGLVRRLFEADEADRAAAGELVDALAGRLRARGWDGDDLLADDLETLVRGDRPPGTVLKMDLADAAETATHGSDFSSARGGFLDRETGEVIDAFLTSEDMDEEDRVDIDAIDWVRLEDDGRDGWRDMAAFADERTDETQAERLRDAVEGRGAFSRFRRATERLELVDEWLVFREERQLARTRARLAWEDIRPV